jgi:hypothetical protein
MQLEKRGKLLWETMGTIRGWETQQMEWVWGDNYGERVLNLIVEYMGFIDFGPWREPITHHVRRIALAYPLSTCSNFLVCFPKDAVAELFHYTWAPQNLATSNSDNNKLQYYYSLLVYYYEK